MVPHGRVPLRPGPVLLVVGILILAGAGLLVSESLAVSSTAATWISVGPATNEGFTSAATPSVTGNTCPNSNYYGLGTQLTLQNVVDCAGAAGFTGDLEITFVSMAYQESGFCPGAIESGSGTCSDTGPGCSGNANAEGILQEGTAGQCPPAGGSFAVSGYSPSSCSTWSGSSTDWGGIYFNPTCSFQWALAYYNVNGYAFWGSYLSGAYCNWAPDGFLGTGSVTCSGTNQNQANLPWSTVCPGNVCSSSGPGPLAATYSVLDKTTDTSESCGGTFSAQDSIVFNGSVTGGTTPYTYAWSFGYGGSGSGNPITHVYTQAGTVTPLLNVTDKNGNATSTGAGCTFTVTAVPVPTISAFTISPSSLLVGGTTFLNTTVTGGTPGYTYAYSGLPSGCSTSNAAKITCTPTATGTFSVSVKVTDAKAQTATKSASLTVNPAIAPSPTIVAFTISPGTIPLGGTTFLNATVSGGSPPYTYAYSGLPSGCTSSNASSIACVPTSVGTSTIALTVTDTKAKTATASASLTVNSDTVGGPTISSFTAGPSTIVLGGATYLNVSAAGGTPPYTYSFQSLPTGCASGDTSSLRCVPTVAGSFSITATVDDSDGNSVQAQTHLTVDPATATELTLTSFAASPASLDLGGSTFLNVTVSGGSAPYSFAYLDLPAGCATSDSGSLLCAPTVAGSFLPAVTVTDGAGSSVSGTTTLTVEAPSGYPSIAGFTATPRTVSLGGITHLSTTVEGGVSPYAYQYGDLPRGCSSEDVDPLTCAPTSLGTYVVGVYVSDSDGHGIESSLVLTVVAATPAPSIRSFTATPSSLGIGSSTQFAVQASGGTAPLTYAYAGLPGGCFGSNSSSLTCAPSGSGTFNVTVTVSDVYGQSASRALTLVVSAPSPATGPSWLGLPLTSTDLLWILVGTVAIGGAIAGAMVVRRRRSREVPPPEVAWGPPPEAGPPPWSG